MNNSRYGDPYRGYGPGDPAHVLDWQRPGPYTGVGPHGYSRSDARLQDEVCALLTQHGEIDASGIDVNVQDGVVTLAGTVDSRRAKRQAEDAADSIYGVQDVRNELHIKTQAGAAPRR